MHDSGKELKLPEPLYLQKWRSQRAPLPIVHIFIKLFSGKQEEAKLVRLEKEASLLWGPVG